MVDAVERIRKALAEVLGGKFEAEIRALVDSAVWYSATLSIEEVFTLWISTKLEQGQDSSWVFEPLRMSERRFLCENLGIAAQEIVGKTPENLAEVVLRASGLPIFRVSGNGSTLQAWKHLVDLVNNDEHERAAVVARQRAERLLRLLLYFYCSTRFAVDFVATLENPGSLRIPKRLEDEISNTDAERPRRITNLLLDDGWADLGFLALALRKLSERLVQAAADHVSGAELKLFTIQEHETFLKLSTALQPYTHDRPSKVQSMQRELRDALLEVVSALTSIIARGVLPEEVIVIEVGEAIVGQVFRCIGDAATTRYYRATSLPAVGRKILMVPSTNCDYARCEWVDSPW